MATSVTRLEAISDGVFGVALTLLLTNLNDIRTRPEGETSEGWWDSLTSNSWVFFAVFLLVGIYWVAHKNECKYLTHSDRIVDWLNLLFLAAIALFPVSSSVLANALQTASFNNAVTFYFINVAGAGTVLTCLFGYVTVQGWLNADGRAHRVQTTIRNVSLPALCGVSLMVLKVAPSFARGHRLWFVIAPPLVYLAFTVAFAVGKRLASRYTSSALPDLPAC